MAAIDDVDASGPTRALPGARPALLLLLAINLFNYIDRQILAEVEPDIRKTFFAHAAPASAPAASHVPWAHTQTGMLAPAFLLAYLVMAPIFGWVADRASRWLLIGICVLIWTLASGASGLAATFNALLISRVVVGIGEAGYGPAAPTILSDLYPRSHRSSVLAWFYMAIPVGSALGYLIGALLKPYGWRYAFYSVVPGGLLLGVLCLFMRDPARGQADPNAAARQPRKAKLRDYLTIFTTPSFMLDTAGMAAMTFAIGGIAFWMPDYLEGRAGSPEHVGIVFGVVVAVAGILATLLGGIVGDVAARHLSGAYFLVCSCAIFISVIFVLLMARSPFPRAWVYLFLAVFFLFFNTGPSNTILVNVIHPSLRVTAFGINIFVIHLLGDALSPPLLGRIIDHYSAAGPDAGWRAAFYVVSAFLVVGGILWLWGARYLDRDMRLATRPLHSDPVTP